MVEHGWIDEADFRDFMFANPVALLHRHQPDVLQGHASSRAPSTRFLRGGLTDARSPARRRHRRRRHRRAAPASPTSASATAASSPIGVDRRAGRPHDRRAGLVVAPGFVDIHTHYDAQLLWDPTRQPVAAARRHHRDRRQLRLHHRPARRPSDADYVMRMMARVEGMPLDALQAGRRGTGGRFGEYLDRLDGRARASTPASSSATRRCGAW